MEESIYKLYKSKFRRKPLPVFIKRGETKIIKLRFKNTGKASWYDVGRTSKVPEGHLPVVARHIKEKNDNFRVKLGEDVEKNSLKFDKALDKHGRKKTIPNIVHPGEKAVISAVITAKKFTLRGLYDLKFNLGFKDKDEAQFAEESIKVFLHSFNLKDWLKTRIKILQLILMKPGKTVYSITNKSFESKASNTQPVIMCTWKRPENLPKTLEMLGKQTAPTVLYIWNKNKSIRKQIDQIVSKEKVLPIKVYHSTYNIGGFGRFYIAKKISNQYSIFIDDDQNFATDTVSKLLKEAKPKTIVSQWAFNFVDLNYWHKQLAEDGKKADYCGTAGMILDNKIFQNEEVYKCPKQYWFIEDLWLSYIASNTPKWELRKSHTEIKLDEDGRDQMYRLVDKKTKMLRYLLSKNMPEHYKKPLTLMVLDKLSFFLRKKKTIYIFGDSHTCVFDYINNTKKLNLKFKTVIVHAGTAMGMVNPNSKTKCLEIFVKKIKSIPKDQSIYFWLGEVDTGFVIWYRAEKYKLSVDSQLKRSTENYFKFLMDLKKQGYKKIGLISVILPTIPDNVAMGEVANLRKEINASQEMRTKLTLRYNEMLEKFCKENRMSFINIQDEMLGPDGKIKPEFLNRDPTNHHCDDEALSNILLRKF